MRYESSGTSLSWIPSEAVTGVNKAAFGSGMTHYDDPLPASIGAHGADLDDLLAADAFRFANVVGGWIEVDDDGRITAADHCGRTLMGATTVRFGRRGSTFAAVEFPVLRSIERHETSVRFVQTTGGHTAVPAPRLVRGAPFVQFEAPTVWTTLALTIHHDGRSDCELVGASPFPRHWIYDHQGDIVAKAGLADFKEWWRTAFDDHTPWGGEEHPLPVTAAESAVERELSTVVMRGGDKPDIRTVATGGVLTAQGEVADEVFLVLDGVLSVEIDGEVLAEVGPGAIVGERAVLEDGVRTSTLRALTAVRVAVSPAALDEEALTTVRNGHRREDAESR